MDLVTVCSNRSDQRRLNAYGTPELTELGNFRHLTRCGTLSDLFLGRTSDDDCVFRGSSRFTWHG
jgi:hypothetical protein